MVTRRSVRLILVAGYGVAAGVLALGAMAWLRDDPAPKAPTTNAAPEVQHPAARTETEWHANSNDFGVDRNLEMPEVPPPAFDPEDPRDDMDLDEELEAIGTMQAVRAASRPSDLGEVARHERTQELTGAEIIPEYRGDEFVGLRVQGSLAEDGMLRAIGVSEGSLITSVNGRYAGDEGVPAEVLFEELSAQSDVEVTLANP